MLFFPSRFSMVSTVTIPRLLENSHLVWPSSNEPLTSRLGLAVLACWAEARPEPPSTIAMKMVEAFIGFEVLISQLRLNRLYASAKSASPFPDPSNPTSFWQGDCHPSSFAFRFRRPCRDA